MTPSTDPVLPPEPPPRRLKARMPKLSLAGAFARLPAWAWPAAVVAVALVLAGAVWAAMQANRAGLERRLLLTPASEVASHPELVRFAVDQARPLFARNCAGCHGADMKGRPGTGAPNLTDKVWLYGDGGVADVELTVLYGIRSSFKKSRNVTEMPAFGQRGELSESDIRNVVQYILSLSGRPNDAGAAELGQAVYNGSANCADCHGGDAHGNTDYGATDLTANVWDYGGDPQALYDSIYYGRHGIMPGFFGQLTLGQIRALAVYVHASSH